MKKHSWKKACVLFFFSCTVILAANARTFTTLYSFSGTDGNNPYVGLVQGTDGNFYGTTIDGGTNSAGNVFKITADGDLTVLYNFCSQSACADGEYPVSVLVQGVDGNFYGTTQSGGASNLGTVYQITPKGKLTVLHSFDGSDGAAPYGSLVLATDGNFYGTADVAGAYGSGTVYKITPKGTLTTLYNFCAQSDCSDGQYPVGGLIQTRPGEFYGITHAGGNNTCTDGCGTIFKMTAAGKLTTLHSFDGSDGDYPYGPVVEDKGMFWGTTGGGGANNWGTVFSMTPSGSLTVVHSFDGDDGSTPYAMMLASDGNLYGTTSTGGNKNKPDGTLFKVTPSGTLTTIHRFNGTDGKDIFAGLVEGTNGILYGAAYFGGNLNCGGGLGCGTIFSLWMGLRPFVETEPTLGKVGTAVRILGNNLEGSSGVSFNGTAAKFHVVSNSEIKTTVPTGATSGKVEVTTPGGTLDSNLKFTVIP